MWRRIDEFKQVSERVGPFFRGQQQLYDSIPSLPWRLPKWAQTQDGLLLEARRASLHQVGAVGWDSAAKARRRRGVSHRCVCVRVCE